MSVSTAHLLAAPRQVTERKASSAQAVKYTVRPGDSLSAIAGRVYHNSDAWPVLYWANHSQIRWANIISAGQVLKVPAKPAKIPSAPGLLGPAAPARSRGPGRGGARPARRTHPCSPPPQWRAGTRAARLAARSVQCVVARESGGNSQVMNSSGHYGLYQFSEGTWVAYGGSAASFGNASVAQQNQVFANALAQGGQSNWSAYDGC